jgi:hypothetical protein
VFQGEYWRLVTVVLVHGGVLHLAFNMYALFIIGPIVEQLYGRARFLWIYLLCAAAGSAASYTFSDSFASVGASGAIFGLFGMLLVADRVHKPALTRNARNLTAQIGVLIGINLLIGFTVPGIDNAAHIGGLLAGAWLGYVLVPRGARLGSFWSSPQGTAVGRGAGPTAGDSRLAALRRPTLLREVGGVAALLGVVVVIVVAGPFTWQVSDFFLGSQPGVLAEALRDPIGVAAFGVTVMLADGSLARAVGSPAPAFGSAARVWLARQWHVHDHGAAGRPFRSLVAQEQAPPGGDAPG